MSQVAGLASHTWGDWITAESIPTTSSRIRTIESPPLVLDIAQQFDAERAVVVSGAQPAVDLGRLEDEAAFLGRG